MILEQTAIDALSNALLGYSASEVAKIQPSDRFAHYTSCAAIEKIIGGDANGKRFLWLRNSLLMNDFTEVEWGKMCLYGALGNRRLNERFRLVLNAIHEELYPRLMKSIGEEHGNLGEKAFLMSLTLHNERECMSGKLSMWRAYGVPNNACLIFNTGPFLNPQTAYETVLSPVMYGGPQEFAREFEAMVHRIERQVNLIKYLDTDLIFRSLRRAIDFAVLSTKHQGFHEESEWRVIHQHSDMRPDPPSIPDPIDSEKQIFQIPIENRPDAGIWGADLSEVLDRIVVGPVENVEASRFHYVDLLTAAGVSHPEDRVTTCGIPYRRHG